MADGPDTKATGEAKAPGEMDLPKELRTIVEASLTQARQAVDSLILVAHRALDNGEQRTDRLQEQAREASRATMQLIEANVAAGFDFAAQLARARTLPEWVKLNQDFAARHAARLAAQAGHPGEPIEPAPEPAAAASAPVEPAAEPTEPPEPAPAANAASAEIPSAEVPAPDEGVAETGGTVEAAPHPAPAVKRGPRRNARPPGQPA
ncbi:phasin family protein [Ancylobacter lacus]|uniref:phasin family protein n=1 Tax=Ancylobacter lacus TaxID=2579970 RepID=UPI001BCD3E85|nr:phasin family protein [Ancylobacter lacus]MBS7539305.1 phasin family protein [Ancylobacter lacus]